MFKFVPANHTRRSFGSIALGETMAEASQSTIHVDLSETAAGASLEANKTFMAGDLLASYVKAGPVAGLPVLPVQGGRYDINSFGRAEPHSADCGHRVIVTCPQPPKAHTY